VNEDNDCLPGYDHDVTVCHTQIYIQKPVAHPFSSIVYIQNTKNKSMIDNITPNHTFMNQMQTNDDANMGANDFDRYIFL
jgi:hypothetical protein